MIIFNHSCSGYKVSNLINIFHKLWYGSYLLEMPAKTTVEFIINIVPLDEPVQPDMKVRHVTVK